MAPYEPKKMSKKYLAAMDPETPGEVLIELSRSKSEHIAKAAFANPSLPQKYLIEKVKGPFFDFRAFNNTKLPLLFFEGSLEKFSPYHFTRQLPGNSFLLNDDGRSFCKLLWSQIFEDVESVEDQADAAKLIVSACIFGSAIKQDEARYDRAKKYAGPIIDRCIEEIFDQDEVDFLFGKSKMEWDRICPDVQIVMDIRKIHAVIKWEAPGRIVRFFSCVWKKLDVDVVFDIVVGGKL